MTHNLPDPLVLRHRDAWQSLQMSRDPAVLCELLKSMPSLMSALGPATTCQELMPAFAMLLQSHLGWIAGELVLVMGELMETLPPSCQELLLKVNYAPSILQITST